MMTSKYIGYFLDEISTWQKRLSMVDQVIVSWFDVQRTWSHLESIFIGSDDIRRQLPIDSQRFDDIDAEFKKLMKEMAKTPNVIVATNVDGLAEQLEGLQGQLSLCEKALAEYLETKRLAFPRFYFASSNDLLDILSNGNQPIKVSKHLTKLFDSMAKLHLREKESKKDKFKVNIKFKGVRLIKKNNGTPYSIIPVLIIASIMYSTMFDFTTYQQCNQEQSTVSISGSNQVSSFIIKIDDNKSNAMQNYT